MKIIFGLIRPLAWRLHAALARGPRWLAHGYLCVLSAVSRNLLPRALAQRTYNAICLDGPAWPEMDFGACIVRQAGTTDIALVPHLGEYDAEALFCRELTYEKPVFAWLAANVPATYDMVIEIGANVGVFAIFLDALCRKANLLPAGTPRIVAFEPSHKVFARLLENFAANDMRFTAAYQAAIGPTSGLQAFFEPVGHLANGSLVRAFSEIFSSQVEERPVITVSASELERWLAPARRPLIKIDVEGFEPDLVMALGSLIERYHPDLLIEVVSFTAGALEISPVLAGYGRHLLTPSGPQPASKLFASEAHRDWLLKWPAKA